MQSELSILKVKDLCNNYFLLFITGNPQGDSPDSENNYFLSEEIFHITKDKRGIYNITKRDWNVWQAGCNIMLLGCGVNRTMLLKYFMWKLSERSVGRENRTWIQPLSPMMTSFHGNVFLVAGPLWGESTSHVFFPNKEPVKGGFNVFFRVSLKPQWNFNQNAPGFFNGNAFRHDVGKILFRPLCIESHKVLSIRLLE